MADFVDQDIKARKSSRVLVIVGSGHRLFLENELRRRGYGLMAASDLLKGSIPARVPCTGYGPGGSTRPGMTSITAFAASTSK
jgi:hypothetical protein